MLDRLRSSSVQVRIPTPRNGTRAPRMSEPRHEERNEREKSTESSRKCAINNEWNCFAGFCCIASREACFAILHTVPYLQSHSRFVSLTISRCQRKANDNNNKNNNNNNNNKYAVKVRVGGQNLERRNVERPIFRNFHIANIKITKIKFEHPKYLIIFQVVNYFPNGI